jgi:hypothetical protein
MCVGLAIAVLAIEVLKGNNDNAVAFAVADNDENQQTIAPGVWNPAEVQQQSSTRTY